MIKWQDKYSAGIEAVDKQHKILFEFVNDLEESIAESRRREHLKKYFFMIESYIGAHFQFEENCMHRYSCPAANANANAHKKFIQYVKEFKDQHKDQEPSEDDVVDFHRFLENWITSHIIGIDTQLKSCVHD